MFILVFKLLNGIFYSQCNTFPTQKCLVAVFRALLRLFIYNSTLLEIMPLQYETIISTVEREKEYQLTKVAISFTVRTSVS
jgi:hypothetical protein